MSKSNLPDVAGVFPEELLELLDAYTYAYAFYKASSAALNIILASDF